MQTFYKICLILMIVGGINWGLVGLFQFDFVGWLLGGSASICSRWWASQPCAASRGCFRTIVLKIESGLALSGADAPAPPKWEPLAVSADFIVMPRPLPLGEVDLRSKDGEGELAKTKAPAVDSAGAFAC